MTRDRPPLGVLVIGAGDMGSRHARHWHDLGERVVAVVDPDLGRAQACAAAVGAVGGRDPAPFLADAGVQVVSVCTPTFAHATHAVAALDAGKHVLCEKPVALTLEDALAMAEAARLSARELRIGFMRRFDPAFEPLNDFTTRIGRPVLAQVTITAGVRPKRLMHDALANGGPIIDMCCHVFNLWDGMFGGQPDHVSARGYTFSEGKPELAGIGRMALDSALITLEYAGGSVGQVQVSWGLPRGIDPVEHHTYVAPDGLVSVDWPQRLTLRDASGVTRWTSTGVDPYRQQIAQFTAELSGAERRVAGVQDGIDALRTSLAVLRSVRERRPVALSEIDAPEPLS